MATYSQQKTFSTKSLAAIPTIGLASMLLHAGSITLPSCVEAQSDFSSALYHDLTRCPEGNEGYVIDYTHNVNITTSSEEVYDAAPIRSKRIDSTYTKTSIKSAIDAVQALSFLEADDEADRAIDLFMLEQPRKKTKKIYIAKRNK